jgi:hypothetical protein
MNSENQLNETIAEAIQKQGRSQYEAAATIRKPARGGTNCFDFTCLQLPRSCWMGSQNVSMLPCLEVMVRNQDYIAL